jgi:hypothetical protein
MNITMLTLQAGPNGVREAGRNYDVPDKEAKALIDGGYAIAVKASVERAVGPRGRQKAVAPIADEAPVVKE